MLRNKRRTKLVTPSNSSFSNCVQDQLFIQPPRAALEHFKPVIYLDDQGRKHARVTDHLLQKQIEDDRQKLKKRAKPRVVPSSALYGIRNPNVVNLIRDVPVEIEEEEKDDDDDKLRADNEVKLIEYKKSSKAGTRQISSISGKQSVKFDTTPSVNMARLVDSHLTELDDVDDENDDDDDDERSDHEDDDDELNSTKPTSNTESNERDIVKKSAFTLSETPATPKEFGEGIQTSSSLDYNRPSQDIFMPPSVEDILDVDEDKQEEQEPSDTDLFSPVVVHRKNRSPVPTEATDERLKSSSTSSRPKTAHSEKTKSNRSSSSSSTSSDDTSALLRSDNDNSSTSSDHELPMTTIEVTAKTPIDIDNSPSTTTEHIETNIEETPSPQPIDKLKQRNLKGDYNAKTVIRLKESFQPIINEAASYGHVEIVRKLIESGQSVHTQNLLERTPLHEACLSGNAVLVGELLNNGALIDQRDSKGMTPLHVAANHGTIECIRILCEKDCDINAQDDVGQTAAHYIAMHDHADALKYLIKINNMNLSISNSESKLPIHYAARYGSKNVLTLLHKLKLTVNAVDNSGNTVAHEAGEYNQIESIKIMWKFNRNIFKCKNRFGRTPMHTAALFGSTDILHWTLELQIIDINQSDEQGYTMAHLAVSRGHAECFSCLINHHAQLDLYTKDRHESVFDVARRSGKNNRIEQARSGIIRCHCCEEKLAKEKYDKAHARNAVEQLIHTQIQHGYNLNIPVNRSITNLSSQRIYRAT